MDNIEASGRSYDMSNKGYSVHRGFLARRVMSVRDMMGRSSVMGAFYSVSIR